jgi:hypothetical protein
MFSETALHQRKYGPEMREYIVKRIEELKPWYHSIDLGDGIVTPGRTYDIMWEANRKVMDKIDYKGKRVLDIASWDGLWAFEAERRGASFVVSTDVRLQGFSNLLFCREILHSKVVPLCNAPVNYLQQALKMDGIPKKYDIVQHYGLLYHLRDPMLSFAEVRSAMEVGGLMLLETAFVDDDKKSYMAFSGTQDNQHFYGISDTWAPSKLCLREMLLRSMFKPVMEESWQVPVSNPGGKWHMGRICMVAEAVTEDSIHPVDLRKIQYA